VNRDEAVTRGVAMTGMTEYIGDGIYVEFDGFGIWLRANSPDSEKKVYLEPAVLENLNRFAKKCHGEVKPSEFETKRHQV
jgi:hypothetical protein